MEGTPPAEKTPPGLNGKPTPRPAFAGSAAVEAPTPAIVSAAASTPAAAPCRQPGHLNTRGSGKASTAQDTSRSQPTPGRGCHLNAGHLAQLDTSTRGALQPLRLPHPRPRLHPRACAVGELGEICPGAGASAAPGHQPPRAGRGALPDTSTPTAGGARKKHQTRRNGA